MTNIHVYVRLNEYVNVHTSIGMYTYVWQFSYNSLPEGNPEGYVVLQTYGLRDHVSQLTSVSRKNLRETQ